MTGRHPESIGAVDELETYRGELTAYCRRIIGPVDAEDALQDTYLRALQAIDRLENRASLRTWLYRIATNVCFDVLDGRKGRARPMDLGPAGDDIADTRNMSGGASEPDGNPADVAEARETLRPALVAALQHLPPKQRATLILCEVLRWKASEVAELLETSVASVTSALQRARAAVRARDLSAEASFSVDQTDPELLARYANAFEHHDMDALTALIHEDAFRVAEPAGSGIE